MSKIYWKPTADGWRTGENGVLNAPADAEVNEQHPLPIQVVWRVDGDDEYQPADDLNGLPVKALPHPEGYGKSVTVQLVIPASGNYGANDIIAQSETDTVGRAWYYPNCAREPGEQFEIVGASATCSEDSVANRLRLWVFGSDVSTASELDDNAARSFAEADRLKLIGAPIDLPAFADAGVFAMAGDDDIRKIVTPQTSSKDLYVVVETLDAETLEAANMLLAITLHLRYR